MASANEIFGILNSKINKVAEDLQDVSAGSVADGTITEEKLSYSLQTKLADDDALKETTTITDAQVTAAMNSIFGEGNWSE